MTASSPTMVTLHDTWFVECRWQNDGWTVKTVVTLTVVGLHDTGPRQAFLQPGCLKQEQRRHLERLAQSFRSAGQKVHVIVAKNKQFGTFVGCDGFSSFGLVVRCTPRERQTWRRYHRGRRPSSDDSFHCPTVIPPSALDKPSIMKRYHRRRTCSHTSPRRSPLSGISHIT